MSRTRIVSGVAVCCALLGAISIADAADGEPVHRATMVQIDLEVDERLDAAEPGPTLPDDLLRPIGTTRWGLTGLPAGTRFTRTIEHDVDGSLLVRLTPSAGDEVVRLRSNAADAAMRWAAPQRALYADDPARYAPGVIERRDTDGDTERLWFRAERVGSGWVHLPSRPYEVELQRVHVRRAVGGAGFVPHRVLYRWVAPRHGVVVETEWTDAGAASELVAVSYVEQVTAGGVGLRLYADRQEAVIGFPVLYGFDRGENTTIASLDPAAHTTIQDLYSAGSWDFSGNNLTNYPGMLEAASTVAPINTNETCSANECGFTQPNAVLGREDKNWDLAQDLDGSGVINDQDLRTTVNALEREDRAGDVTTWLRAVVRNQGTTSGGFGFNETRVCHVGGGRTGVPLSRFANQDAIGWYKQAGDAWSSDADPVTAGNQPFDCELTIFNHVCPSGCGFSCELWAKQCGTHTGTQFGEVLGEGPITLPSGHTFNAIVERTVADYCVYLAASCADFWEAQRVRQAVYLWQTPVWGTIVRLMSGQTEPDIDTFTTLTETDIKFGLFPPVSIAVGAITDSSVEISWNPGLDTHRIDGYHVYWDTDSGAGTPYAFDQLVPAGQTSLVVSGLDPGTEYFFTVSTVSDFTNPDTLVTTTYESILFPQPTDVIPGPVPGEVSATTTSPVCTPTTEIDGVTASRVGADVELCWTPSVDPCVDGYRILGAASPQSDANFQTVVADTGPVSCVTVTSTDSYFLVVGVGTGGTGPWGHYGR